MSTPLNNSVGNCKLLDTSSLKAQALNTIWKYLIGDNVKQSGQCHSPSTNCSEHCIGCRSEKLTSSGDSLNKHTGITRVLYMEPQWGSLQQKLRCVVKMTSSVPTDDVNSWYAVENILTTRTHRELPKVALFFFFSLTTHGQNAT